MSKVSVYNSLSPLKTSKGFEDVTNVDSTDFSMENRYVKVSFSESGLLKLATCKETAVSMPFQLDFVRYIFKCLVMDERTALIKEFFMQILSSERTGKQWSLFVSSGRRSGYYSIQIPINKGV